MEIASRQMLEYSIQFSLNLLFDIDEKWYVALSTLIDGGKQKKA